MNSRRKQNLAFLISEDQCRFIKGLRIIQPKDNMFNVFDYKNQIIKKKHNIKVKHTGNLLYGYEYTLKKYSGYTGQIHASFEHGLRLNDTFQQGETFGTLLPGILTFGEYRYHVLRNRGDKLIFEIGPYIHYAESNYSNFEMQAMKQSLGKTLLIFPSHNIEDLSSTTDTYNFIEQVKYIKNTYHYDTVLACLYFMDILRGKHFLLQDEGFRIVTAGYKWNYDFLNNLKTIIQLCDFAIMEGAGTQMGYLLDCNKPLMVVDSGRKEVITDRKTYSACMEMKIKAESVAECEMKNRETINKLFGVYEENITKEQYEWCNYYWGLDQVKSREELHRIFGILGKRDWKKQPMYETAKKKLHDPYIQEHFYNAFHSVRNNTENENYYRKKLNDNCKNVSK